MSDDEVVPFIDYVKARLDGQDHVLKAIAEDVKATRKQATKTNGRVTELESQARVNEALRAQFQKDTEERVDGKRWLINIAASAIFMISGVALGNIVHVIHIG